MSDTPSHSEATSDFINISEEINSLGGIPECPLDYFRCSLLPALAADASTIPKIKQLLNPESDWAKEYGFPRPGELSGSMGKTFEALSTAFNHVSRVCNSGRDPVIRMANTRGELARRTSPESCLVLCASKSVALDRTSRWSDVVMSWEYEKPEFIDVCPPSCFPIADTNSFHFENASRVLWNMKQTLALDISRRFTFGLTIEDAGFRVWFCDRSGCLVSGESTTLTWCVHFDVRLS